MKHEDYIKTLRSSSGTYQYYKENEAHLDFAEKEKYRFLKDVTEHGKKALMVHAAYGPEEDGYSNAYIDEIVYPEEGGTFTKLYGCPFRLKGISPGNVVFGLGLSKYLLSGFPRMLVKNSKIFILAFGLIWLFNRKGFLGIMCDLLYQINHRVVQPLTYSRSQKGQWPEKWYNNCEKEIERALLESSRGEGLWEKFFTLLSPFLKLFLYIDNTYRSRIQDALPEGNNIKEVLDVLRKRDLGPWRTWQFMKYALGLALMTSPALRKIEKRFYKTLDKNKIKMDGDDWYFCLTYKSYNFKDILYKERVNQREELNRKHNVVLI